MGKHFLYYITLFPVICTGFLLVVFLSGQTEIQMALVIFTATMYALWGIIHHMIHHSFSVKVMLEYISIAILGISMVFFVLRIGI